MLLNIKIFLVITIFIVTSNCSILNKKEDKDPESAKIEEITKKYEETGDLKVRQERYQGNLLNMNRNNNSGNFQFASSNVLWRASLETLDFIPLNSISYSGGVIITDWYSSGSNKNESLKIVINFKSSELHISSIEVNSYKKTCEKESNDCIVLKTANDFNKSIKEKILNKARALNIASKNKSK